MADGELIEDENREIERWFQEIELSEKRDKDWQKTGRSIYSRYRNEARILTGQDTRKADEFNILWSNTEVSRPALYSRTPRPDIRRRFSSDQKENRYLVEALERSAKFIFDDAMFDERMKATVNDMLLPGRGVLRVRYMPTFQGEGEERQVVDEKIKYQSWDWDKVLFGPGSRWEDLSWIAFIHEIDKSQVKKQFPKMADSLNFDASTTQGDHYKTDKEKREEARLYKRITFYEIWDKKSKQVKWVTKAYKDDFVEVQDDPLELKNFWPMPKPMYAIESTTSLVPVPEFIQYEELANQLEDCTVRMGRITRALRVRGIYDSTMAELNKLFDAGDNEMIPAESLNRLLEAGGLDKAVWMMPNDDLANVLQILQQYRGQLIQQIYELTGISDILRGSTNPHETLGAQQMKANFGSQRLDRKRAEVQRFVKDILNITVEIVAEKFQIQTLRGMTGLPFMTNEEKQQAQMQMQQQAMMAQQQAQMTGQEPQQPEVPPELQRALAMPSWEDIKGLMTRETLREYVVDIETDSTIQADQQADQEALASMLQGISQFGHGVGPLIDQGVLTMEAAKQLLISTLRRFRMGREAEEAIENSVGQQENQQGQQEQQAAEMDMQQKQMELQAEQQKVQVEMQKLQMQAEQARAEHQMEMERMQLERVQAQEKHQFEMRRIAAQNQETNNASR